MPSQMCNRLSYTANFLCIVCIMALQVSSLSSGQSVLQQDTYLSKPPFLALITEPDACSNEQRMEETYLAIQNAISSNTIELVSIRLSQSAKEDEEDTGVFDRAVELTRKLVDLSKKQRESGERPFQVVCSSDWVEVAIQAKAHGVHVKEKHLSIIPQLRKSFPYPIVIGTSTHSLRSALESFETYRPQYYFVGTCFPTQSHPEKDLKDLEGPKLPSIVKKRLSQGSNECPKVLAIGGINEKNCHIPVAYSADGVAAIRSIIKAKNPSAVAVQIHANMINPFSSSNRF